MSEARELVGTHSLSEQVVGGRATLVLRRFLRHPPPTVWRAITDPEQIRQWFLTTATIDGRVGGEVVLVLDPVGVRSTGRILAWEPPRVYAYELNLPGGTAPGAPSERIVVRWELTPTEGGTLLALTHRDLKRGWTEVLKVGLPFFLIRLEAQLDGREPPDWESRVEQARRFERG